jgi:hypothetical protein
MGSIGRLDRAEDAGVLGHGERNDDDEGWVCDAIQFLEGIGWE